jgi:hypothetical protein
MVLSPEGSTLTGRRNGSERAESELGSGEGTSAEIMGARWMGGTMPRSIVY